MFTRQEWFVILLVLGALVCVILGFLAVIAVQG